jgi:hypothetical protein
VAFLTLRQEEEGDSQSNNIGQVLENYWFTRPRLTHAASDA